MNKDIIILGVAVLIFIGFGWYYFDGNTLFNKPADEAIIIENSFPFKGLQGPENTSGTYRGSIVSVDSNQFTLRVPTVSSVLNDGNLISPASDIIFIIQDNTEYYIIGSGELVESNENFLFKGMRSMKEVSASMDELSVGKSATVTGSMDESSTVFYASKVVIHSLASE